MRRGFLLIVAIISAVNKIMTIIIVIMLLNVNRQPEARFELYSDSPISVPPPPIGNVIILLVINMFHYIYP